MIKWQNTRVARKARDRVIVGYRLCGLYAVGIAEAMRLSTATVYSVLQAYGINFRSDGYYQLYGFSREQLDLPDWLPDRSMPDNGLDVPRGARIEAELIEKEPA